MPAATRQAGGCWVVVMVCLASGTSTAAAVGCRRQCIHDFLTCHTLGCVLAQPILSQGGCSGLKLLRSANSQGLAGCLRCCSALRSPVVGGQVALVAVLADLYIAEVK